MKNIILSLVTMLTLLGCSPHVVREVDYKTVLRQPFPAAGGTWRIRVDASTVADSIEDKYIDDKPWKIWCNSDAWHSADGLQVKGKWYRMYWVRNELYLKLKRNRREERDVLIGISLSKTAGAAIRVTQKRRRGR